MHELSIASSLIDVVVEHAIEAGASRVRRIVVEVGALSGVLPAALQTAFIAASKDDDCVRGATLDFRETNGRELDVVRIEFDDDHHDDNPAAHP